MKKAGLLIFTLVLFKSVKCFAAANQGATAAKVTYVAGTAKSEGGNSVPLKRKGRLLACPRGLVFEFKGRGQKDDCQHGDWKISYDEITALARGYQTKGSSETLAVQVASVAGTIVAALGNLNVWWKAGIIGASAAALIIFTIPKDNFITIFFDPDFTRAKTSRGLMKVCATKSVACFPQGEIAVFKIHSRHAYWNTSMVLDAKTGLAFESESAVSK